MTIGLSVSAQMRYNLKPVSALDGRVTVFFSGSVDSERASRNNLANGLENLEQRVIDAINAARTSVDLAAYELTSLNLAIALCKARQRGLRVRVVLDDEGSKDNNEKLWQWVFNLFKYRYDVPFMTDGGWPVVKNKKNYFKDREALMHDKFLIVDADSPDPNDDFVITGSFNFTPTGAISMQNIVQIRSEKATRLFTEEFELMWGSNTATPDTAKAAFHDNKAGLKNSSIIFPGALEAYFSPRNKNRSRPDQLEFLADLVTKEAQHDIKICSFSFGTGIEVDDAIREKHERQGVKVKGLFDKSLTQKWSLYHAMRGDSVSKYPWKKPAEAYRAFEDNDLHHKYILIDAETDDPNDVPVVITGSFNFSKNSNERNDENFIVIRDRAIANQFLQEFYARWESAKSSLKR